jgi:hypothetical protein
MKRHRARGVDAWEDDGGARRSPFGATAGRISDSAKEQPQESEVAVGRGERLKDSSIVPPGQARRSTSRLGSTRGAGDRVVDILGSEQKTVFIAKGTNE